MKQPKQQIVFKKSILALSVLMAIGVAHADEDEDVVKLTKYESSVSVGAGNITGYTADRSIFTQYNGMRNNDVNILLDINVLKLNDEKGLWTKFEGHNLLLDDRELTFSNNRQGDWKYSLEYNEITHHEIRTINTGLQNAGTVAPIVTSLATPGTGTNLNLQLQRQIETLGVEKWISPNLLFETSFKNEDKIGSRLSGEGITCSNIGFPSRYPCGGAGIGAMSGALLMLPEPVKTNSRQIEVKLNYSESQFLVTGGYYGAFFTNDNGSLNPVLNGSLYNPNGTVINPGYTGLTNYLTAPIALQPNNQSQQVYVSGNYAFTPTTHSTFKYGYTHSTQDESFSSMGLSGGPAGSARLGAVVDTNLVQLGLSARPVAKLTVVTNLRYEDKNDKTPVTSYNLSTPSSTPYSNNYSSSSRKVNGKLEAAYQLPDHYRATLGVDYASVARATPPSGSSIAASDMGLALGGLRENTHEVSYRGELKRSFTDTFNASVNVAHSQRTGDSWTIYSASGTLPMTMMDRKRDKIKLMAEWMPTRLLSVQFIFENGKDSYSGLNTVGMRDTSITNYGIDSTFNLSESWKLTGYLNQSQQTLHISHIEMCELTDVNTSAAFGVTGKLSGKLDVGGNLSYMNDSNRYSLSNADLPNVTYRVTSLKLFGKYAVKKDADFRVDLVHLNARLDEWTWGNNGTPFTYSDNTTVSLQPNQSVTFLGASYVYKFR